MRSFRTLTLGMLLVLVGGGCAAPAEPSLVCGEPVLVEAPEGWTATVTVCW